FAPARWQLSSARTRWGSCNAKSVIRLNWRLIHKDPMLIDYVVVHELAHLKELNHSPRFWAIVESVLPDYRERKRLLRHDQDPVNSLPKEP
ncbi:MAG: M48 family peptidase, partial [Betaproteobacteria bacterium]|nr:M48 family peptidase [Betaproteobacteria bacterium]